MFNGEINAPSKEHKSTYSRILSPHLLFLFSQVFTVDVHSKSPILVGNLARIILPMNPLCTKWRARGQVVCLLLIKPFDQSLFNSAHVVLWAPPVCSARQRALLLVQQNTASEMFSLICAVKHYVYILLSSAPRCVSDAGKVVHNGRNRFTKLGKLR